MTNASCELKPHPVSKILPEMPSAEFQEFVEDIKANGLREPIVLYEGKILDGNHRYRACVELDIEPETRNWDGKGLAVDFVISMNLKRRHLTAGQRAACAVDALPFYEREAKQRQRESGKKHGRGKKVGQKIDRPMDGGRATEKAAKNFGTNRQYVTDYRAVKTTISQAKRQIRRKRDLDKAAKAPPPKAAPKYPTFQCIVIDPPWYFRDLDVPDADGRATPEHSTMSLKDLQELPMQEPADVNCHLYVRLTNRGLPFGFQLLDAWDFSYATTLTWCRPSIGVGNYFRTNTEHLLFGVMGELALLREDVGTWLEARACRPHSTNSDAFFEFVESCSPGPRLEMFAAEERAGWTMGKPFPGYEA